MQQDYVHRLLMLSTFIVGYLCVSVCGAEDPSGVLVEKLTLQYTKTVPLNRDHASVVLADGRKADIPVTLEVSRYESTVVRHVDGSPRQWSGRVYCWSLKSRQKTAPFEWSWWSYGPQGEFQLIDGSGGRLYLAWVEYASVRFAEISRANDKIDQLKKLFVKNGQSADAVLVPVGKLVPEAYTWGVNAHYLEIKVTAIGRDALGNWVLEIRGPKEDQVYTLISDPTAELGWRVQQTTDE